MSNSDDLYAAEEAFAEMLASRKSTLIDEATLMTPSDLSISDVTPQENLDAVLAALEEPDIFIEAYTGDGSLQEPLSFE